MIDLHHVDCMEYLATCEDNAFELAIVDPPYGIGESGGKIRTNKKRPCYELRKKKSKYTRKDWDSNIPDNEYFLELKRVSKNQIIWGANYMVENLSPSMGWVFWDKKNEGTVFSDGELAFTSFNRGLKMFRLSSKHGTCGGKYRIHPTQKPVKLYEWLLINYAKEGDRILDTHLGSGSIAIACHNLGYDLVGCELDEDYYHAACDRLDKHKKQLRIF